MTSYVGPNDRRVILGGVLGAGLLILLMLTGTNPRWRQITLSGLDSGDKVTQIIGHDVVRTQALYVQASSGTAYSCRDSINFIVAVASCQKIDRETARKELEASFQCQHERHFPTISPPEVPAAEFESYPCWMGFFQTNHIVLSDGSLWRLEQGIAEDDEYWTLFGVVISGIFGFLAGMIGTALILVLNRRLRQSDQ
jgi:hypothetical protein